MKINKVGWTYFAIIENFLTKEECYDIINACQGTWNYSKIPAGVYPNGWQSGLQKRHIGNPFEVQFKDKIDLYTDKFNEMTYNFNLLPTYKHFVNRYEMEDLLEWHQDNHESIEDLFKKSPARRISVSIYLNEDYEGGEFELANIGSWKLRAGTAVIFPSSVKHKSHIITRGKKYNYTVMREGVRGA